MLFGSDMKSGIYKIINKLNGKFYVGMSVNIESRWQKHRCPSGQKNGTVLARAFAKHGVDNFDFEIIELCPIGLLCEKERHYIKTLSPNYNASDGGDGSRGHSVSESVRATLKAKGKEQWEALSPEQKLLRIKNNLKGPRKGHDVSQVTREKIRIAAKKQAEKSGWPPASLREKASETMRRLHSERPYMRSRSVAMIDKNTGAEIVRFATVKEAAKHIGYHESGIIGVCKGKPKRKTYGGFKWEYRD